MTVVKVIKTEQEHKQALERLMVLMDSEPEANSNDENELEVLSVLIEQYESENFASDLPSPVEAIKFRMDQQGLTQKDLIPYFGSASKVSEVLNGKRTLSLAMIRNLHHELDISAEILIQNPILAREFIQEVPGVSWQQFPLKSMQENGYFEGQALGLRELKTYAEEKVRSFFDGYQNSFDLQPAFLRSAVNLANNAKQINELALWAWQVKILTVAENEKPDAAYQPGTVTVDLMRQLAQLSWSSHGPNIAKEFLSKHGIHLIIEPHLDQTYLDGAVCISQKGNPVIALTLRHDRLDNFWFTLMHELAHIALHLDGSSDWFVDDLDRESEDPREDEANQMARDVLIAQKDWTLDATATTKEMSTFAQEKSISPSIVYGRFAREFNAWRKVSRLIPKASPFFN